MRRRDFIKAASGALAAWPTLVHAQQQPMQVIGFLNSASAANRANLVAAFLKGVGESDLIEGRNFRVEYRWAEDRYERLPDLAADLVRQRVSVIAAIGSSAPGLAARNTSNIPIVFQTGSDPVADGLVSSLNQPGGNVTGTVIFANELEAKRLGLLHEVVPKTSLIAVLINPSNPAAARQWGDVQTAAKALGRQVRALHASTPDDIAAVLTPLTQQGASGLLVTGDPFLASRRQQLASLTTAIPAIYQWREHALVGGLMSYGTDLADSYRQTGFLVGRVLKGEKPANLPVLQSTKFNFVINLKTAKALGLAIPSGILSIADEVIE